MLASMMMTTNSPNNLSHQLPYVSPARIASKGAIEIPLLAERLNTTDQVLQWL